MSTRNRMHNSLNPFQGIHRRVLCVCSAGLLRSPTTAEVLSQEFGHNTRSCGCEREFALIPFDQVLFEWCDEIVCMTDSHRQRCEAIIGPDIFEKKPCTVLEINDDYAFRNKELIEMIKDRYEGNDTER